MGNSGGFGSGHRLSDAISTTKSTARSETGYRIWPLLAVNLLVLLFSTYALADSGAATYKEHCASCHGANGAADTMLGRNLKLRSLASAEVQRQSDDELTAITSRGKGKMPAYDRKLSKDQIGDVVKYIRTLKK